VSSRSRWTSGFGQWISRASAIRLSSAPIQNARRPRREHRDRSAPPASSLCEGWPAGGSGAAGGSSRHPVRTSPGVTLVRFPNEGSHTRELQEGHHDEYKRGQANEFFGWIRDSPDAPQSGQIPGQLGIREQDGTVGGLGSRGGYFTALAKGSLAGSDVDRAGFSLPRTSESLATTKVFKDTPSRFAVSASHACKDSGRRTRN